MDDTINILKKLHQIEEHARALAGELPSGALQNRARLILGLASQLVLNEGMSQLNGTGPKRPAADA